MRNPTHLRHAKHAAAHNQSGNAEAGQQRPIGHKQNIEFRGQGLAF